MSLYDKISIGLGSGSGFKASKLYSLLPTNGDGDFTVTRNTTASLINKDGLLEEVAANVPRWDYSKSECPALLLENASTNTVVNSEPTANEHASDKVTYEAYNWGVIGFTNCVRYTPVTGSAAYRLAGTTLTSTVYTISVYVIMDDGSVPTASTSNSTGDFTFQIGNTPIYNTWKIEGMGNNVYRCSTYGSSTESLPELNYSGILKYDAQSNKSFRVTGYQLEEQPYPTSYIKTTGIALTRNKDEVNGSGTSAEFNGSSGVLYANIAALQDDLTHRLICISDGTTQQRVFFGYYNTTNTINCRVINSGVEQANFYYTIDDITKFHKIAVSYKLNDFSLWIDGIKVDADTSGILPTGLNDLSFNQVGNHIFYGYCKEVIVFKESLTDEELIKLTT